MVIPKIPRGLPRRPCGAPRNDNGGGVAQEDPGHGYPQNPEGIATSPLQEDKEIVSLFQRRLVFSRSFSKIHRGGLQSVSEYLGRIG